MRQGVSRLRRDLGRALSVALSASLMLGGMAKAMENTKRGGADDGWVDRSADDHEALATRRVLPDIEDVRDWPWMSGKVSVEVHIDENGRVLVARALYGETALAGPAESAAKQWEFRPYVVDGVRRRVRTAIHFDLATLPIGIHSRSYVDIVEKALRERPDSSLTHYNAGFAYDTFGNRHDDAVEYFRKALAARPDWALAWYALGHAYYGLERYELAIQAYEKALSVDPSLFDAALEIGWCLDRLNPRRDSSAAFERAARLAKSAQSRIAALRNLTESCARTGRLKESADARFEMACEMRRFVGIEPGNFYDVARVAYDVAKNYESIGEDGRMLESFTLGMNANPPSYFGMLSRLECAEHLQVAGARADAARMFESSIELVAGAERMPGAARDVDTRTIRHYWRARALLGLGKYKEALEQSKVAVKLKPDWDRGRYLLGQVYLKLGERSKAGEEFRRSGLVDEEEIRRRIG